MGITYHTAVKGRQNSSKKLSLLLETSKQWWFIGNPRWTNTFWEGGGQWLTAIIEPQKRSNIDGWNTKNMSYQLDQAAISSQISSWMSNKHVYLPTSSSWSFKTDSTLEKSSLFIDHPRYYPQQREYHKIDRTLPGGHEDRIRVRKKRLGQEKGRKLYWK